MVRVILRRVRQVLLGVGGIYKKVFKEKSILDYHIHPSSKLYGRENITLSKTSLICEYVIVRAPIGKLKVGDNTQIGPFTVIFTSNDIIIGNNVLIAPHCVIASGNHDYSNINVPIIEAGDLSRGPIKIGDDVWIGANCTIVDNVTIGRGAVIAANSLINKDVKPYTVVGGVPAKFLKSRINEII